MDLHALSEDELFAAARQAAVPMCVSPCAALCCRTGKLNCADETELARVLRGKDAHVTQEWDSTFSIDLSNRCTSLDDENRCAGYATRPKGCREFPVFRYGKDVVIAPQCPAQGLLAPYVDELRRRGFRVV